MSLLFMAFLVAALGCATAYAADHEPLEPAKADLILQNPPGSLSLGTTSGGALIAGERLEEQGPGWKLWFKVPRRGTHHGTEELAGVIRHVGGALRQAHPEATLVVGNPKLRKRSIKRETPPSDAAPMVSP